MMQFRLTLSTLFCAAALVAAPSAFACGDEKGDKDDTDEPSVLCGDEKGDKDDTDEPSVLCGDEKGDKDDTDEPS